MKIVSNDIIPPKGYKAMTLWPLLFVRTGATMWPNDMRHEEIHGLQQREMLAVGCAVAAVLFATGYGWWSLLAVPLYLWMYGILYLCCLVRYRSHREAYRGNPFEAEAYANEDDVDYLDSRPLFAWVRYIGRTTNTNNKKKGKSYEE